MYGDGTKVSSLWESLMQVFVTGGTGTIGSAVVAELLAGGHTVLALARSDTSAQALTDTGARVLRGRLTDQARRTGVAGYPGDGTQRWPAVHALDAAVLFRLAIESAPAATAWHAVADEGDAVRDIAAVVGRRLGLPVEPVPQENFGPFGPIFAMDQPATSAHTREALGWQPTHPNLP